MTPAIALAASARDWPDRLHRHLLDHGGGRVAARVLGPDQALSATFEVLFIDDVCSFLSPRLVSKLREKGAEVVGVFDPSDGPDAKRRLLECGISDVMESDAGPEEMLALARSVVSHRVPTFTQPGPVERSGWVIGVTGATAGVGATEISVALASAISKQLDVVLLDLDPYWPSVAPRLDLSLHPNVRTAVDFVLHQPDQLSRSLQTANDLAVIGGVADRGAAAPIGHAEAEMLIEALGATFDLVVVDLGPLDRALRALVRGFDTLAVVGTGDPVGVNRMTRTVEIAVDLGLDDGVVLVANKVPPGSYYHAEVRTELAITWPDLPVVTLPVDPRVAEAAWNGVPSVRGPFSKSIERAAALITESVVG